MSYENLDSQRRDTADAILSKFGEAIEKAQQKAAARSNDPKIQKLMAARAALEYAVLATAKEKAVATEVVASALKDASASQQSAMLKDGAAALGRAYRVEPELLASAFAGQMTDLKLPNGIANVPEIDKMVDACRVLVTSIVSDEYKQFGRYGTEEIEPRNLSFTAPKSDGGMSPAKTELATRLAFLESAIDATASKGKIDGATAQALKERIERQVFRPTEQASQISKAFLAFFEQRGTSIRIEAMKEVRGVTQSRTVREIGAKLNSLLLAKTDERFAHSPLER